MSIVVSIASFLYVYAYSLFPIEASHVSSHSVDIPFIAQGITNDSKSTRSNVVDLPPKHARRTGRRRSEHVLCSMGPTSVRTRSCSRRRGRSRARTNNSRRSSLPPRVPANSPASAATLKRRRPSTSPNVGNNSRGNVSSRWKSLEEYNNIGVRAEKRSKRSRSVEPGGKWKCTRDGSLINIEDLATSSTRLRARSVDSHGQTVNSTPRHRRNRHHSADFSDTKKRKRVIKVHKKIPKHRSHSAHSAKSRAVTAERVKKKVPCVTNSTNKNSHELRDVVIDIRPEVSAAAIHLERLKNKKNEKIRNAHEAVRKDMDKREGLLAWLSNIFESSDSESDQLATEDNQNNSKFAEQVRAASATEIRDTKENATKENIVSTNRTAERKRHKHHRRARSAERTEEMKKRRHHKKHKKSKHKRRDRMSSQEPGLRKHGRRNEPITRTERLDLLDSKNGENETNHDFENDMDTGLDAFYRGVIQDMAEKNREERKKLKFLIDAYNQKETEEEKRLDIDLPIAEPVEELTKCGKIKQFAIKNIAGIGAGLAALIQMIIILWAEGYFTNGVPPILFTVISVIIVNMSN